MFDTITSHLILILAIALLLFISVSILCKSAMLPDVKILQSPQEEEVHSWSLREQMYTSGSTFIKKIKSFVCLSLYWYALVVHKKTRLQDKLLRH